jgi:uncharacterized protein
MSGKTGRWLGGIVLAGLAVASGAVFLAVAGAGGGCVDGDPRLGWTPLMRAARSGRVEAIERQVARGADLEARDRKNGWTALLHAVHKRQPAAVRALIAAGADVEARSRSGAPALVLAAGDGDREIVTALLAAGADPYARDAHRVDAFVAAEMSGDPGVKAALLRAAPDLPRRSDRGMLLLVRSVNWVTSYLPEGVR